MKAGNTPIARSTGKPDDMPISSSPSARSCLISGKLGLNERLALGIYMENTPEFIYAALGAGLSNSILFAINTGFRGETLAKVINQANITRLIMNASTAAEVERVMGQISVLGPEDILYVGGQSEIAGKGYQDLEQGGSRCRTRRPAALPGAH